ncbi:S8 family serine peptidase [Cryomorphaceae bacterium 1068]|nr:S8 family serine peptidase [Cryomorphaceae bacterium 1068]
MKFITHLTILFFIPLSGQAQQKTDWFNLSFVEGETAGADVSDALKLIGDSPLDTIIVAVIDDGVDIYHEDFEGKIWTNIDEIPDNGLDDDGNGYIDDVHGWNYLGNPNGENIKYETLELTRLYRQYSKEFEHREASSISKSEDKDYKTYLQYKEEFEEELTAIETQFSEYAQLAALYKGAQAFYFEEVGGDTFSIEILNGWNPRSQDGEQVKSFLLLAEREGLSEYLEEGAEYFENFLEYNLNIDFDPRPLVNEEELPIGYGNQMVWAEDPSHGTHVAGIIAAVRSNGKGIDGIAPNAIIMPLRAVPGGDERDKDIALAIRYAVDNGAKIINMSFGKAYSPQAELVFDAIKYAAKNDVLLVHAAGNDASDNDEVLNYPDGTLGKSKSAKNLLTVAAGSSDPDASFLADFSNYGKKSVDIIAPGVEINSLAPDNQTASQSGTSMAAPVVSGVAALVWGLDPDLSAVKLKRLLVNSANDLEDLMIVVEGKTLPLGDFLRNPAVVSAEGAVEELLD